MSPFGDKRRKERLTNIKRAAANRLLLAECGIPSDPESPKATHGTADPATTGLVDHQHAGLIAARCDNVATYLVAQCIGIPATATKQRLHPIRPLRPSLLRREPAGLALDPRQQAVEKGATSLSQPDAQPDPVAELSTMLGGLWAADCLPWPDATGATAEEYRALSLRRLAGAEGEALERDRFRRNRQ
jgi:hypothetical protein